MSLLYAPEARLFKAIVQVDIEQRLAFDEWQALRACVSNKLIPAQLVDEAITEVFGLMIPEHLAWAGLVVAVGRIDGSPVNYISGKGIYNWAWKPGCAPYLSILVTPSGLPSRLVTC